MSTLFAMVGRLVGSYAVTRKLGEGGMGVVYEAVHKTTGRHVAIKFLHDDFQENQELLNRFFNEAIASSALDHPGMVQIFDSGMLDEEIPYLIMEYLRGSSLEQRLAALKGQQGLPLLEALNVAWQTAAVLAEMESRWIVHRDLKPGNLMLVPDAVAAQGVRVKLLDLGLAKLNRELYASAVNTRRGMTMGTPLYMSPEQCGDSSDVDGKSDVYSLGVVLFEMLTGQPPLNTAGFHSMLALHMFAPVPRLRDVAPEAPEALDNLVFAMLSKNAADRPAMFAVRDRLAKLLAGPPAHVGVLPVVRPPMTIPECSAVTNPAPSGMLSRLAQRGQSASRSDEWTLLPLLAPAAQVLPAPKPQQPVMPPWSAASGIWAADTQEALLPLSALERSEGSLTVKFIRLSPAAPPLPRPHTMRRMALLGGLVFLISMLLCLDSDTPDLGPGRAAGEALSAPAAMDADRTALAR